MADREADPALLCRRHGHEDGPDPADHAAEPGGNLEIFHDPEEPSSFEPVASVQRTLLAA